MNKKVLIAAIASLLLAAAAVAESTDPKLVEGAMPAYPDAARVKNVHGTVVIEALVDENGRVFAADVVESVAVDLDKAALAAVEDWVFDPALEDGKPVMKVVRIPVRFDLIDPVRDAVMQGQDRAIVNK